MTNQGIIIFYSLLINWDYQSFI